MPEEEKAVEEQAYCPVFTWVVFVNMFPQPDQRLGYADKLVMFRDAIKAADKLFELLLQSRCGSALGRCTLILADQGFHGDVQRP